MPLGLWAWLSGWLEIRVTGRNIPSFLSLAAASGLTLWRIRPRREGVHACIRAAEYRALPAIVRATGCRARIRRRRGLPFLLRRLLRRRVLTMGAVVFLLAFYALASHVWVVDVRGAQQLNPEQILQAAAELGLAPGAYKPALDVRALEKELPVRLPQLSWVGIRLSGTRAVIEVAEKHDPGPALQPKPGRCDIVAAKAGLVTHVVAYTGTPLVREGDVVTQGQVLIRGEIVPEPQVAAAAAGDQEKAPTWQSQSVCARGRVEARVWYHQYTEMALEQAVSVPTGRVFVRRWLALGQDRVLLSGWGKLPFASYRMTERMTRLQWRQAALPVAWISQRFAEIAEVKESLSPVEAWQRAKATALQQALAQVPAGATVLRQQVEPRAAAAGYVAAYAVVETLEQIAETQVP